MNRVSSFVLTIVMVLSFLGGCGPVSDGEKEKNLDDGVEVGNGMNVAHYNSKYKFHVSYNPDLKVSKETDEEFSVDNTTLLKPGEKKSVISFHVFPKGKVGGKEIRNIRDLEAWVREECAKEGFKSAKFDGIAGFSCRVRNKEKDFLSARHYMLTPRGDVIFVKIEAHGEGDGFTRVAPIVHTFDYDDTPPELLEVKLSGAAVVPTPSSVGLFFKARDASSGILPIAKARFVPVTDLRGKPWETTRKVETKGDDWYRMEVEFHKDFKRGAYVLRDLVIWDKVKNAHALEIDPKLLRNPPDPAKDPAGQISDIGFYSSSERKEDAQTTIPILKMDLVEKATLDKKKPIITSVEFRPREVKAGSEGSLLFTVTDDDPEGIPLFSSNWGQIKAAFKTADSAKADLTILSATSVAGGTYQLKFSLGSYLPPGDYFLNVFGVKDRSGNERLRAAAPKGEYEGAEGEKISIATMSITNDGRPDVEAPVVEELRVVTPTVRQGLQGAIFFKATDNLSGVADFEAFVGKFSSVLGGVGPKGIQLLGLPVRVLLMEDWYSIEFDVPADTPVGEYYLRDFRISDSAGNMFRMTAMALAPRNTVLEKYDLWPKEGDRTSLDIPVQRIEVVK